MPSVHMGHGNHSEKGLTAESVRVPHREPLGVLYDRKVHVHQTSSYPSWYNHSR